MAWSWDIFHSKWVRRHSVSCDLKYPGHMDVTLPTAEGVGMLGHDAPSCPLAARSGFLPVSPASPSIPVSPLLLRTLFLCLHLRDVNDC